MDDVVVRGDDILFKGMIVAKIARGQAPGSVIEKFVDEIQAEAKVEYDIEYIVDQDAIEAAVERALEVHGITMEDHRQAQERLKTATAKVAEV